MKKILTLAFVLEPERILLAMKKRGFGAGRWNGAGGKVEAGEMIEDAARRETREEIGITAESLEKLGILEFEFIGNPVPLEVHIFKIAAYRGAPSESDEMRPQWFSLDDIPYDDMWPDDRYWLPLFIAGKKFRGRVLFGGGDAIVEQSIMEVQKPD